MTRDEAKALLLLYRPDTADAGDPQIAAALAVARQDQALSAWLGQHAAEQSAVRRQLRKIAAPAGLKEQIISEQAAQQKRTLWLPKLVLPTLVATVALILLSGFWFIQSRPAENSLATYQNRMAGVALRGYAMDLATNNVAAIRTFLSQHHAPSDFVLPAGLTKTPILGCAVEDWQGVKVTMLCFRTSKPLAPEIASDLWLFVVDQSAVKYKLAGTGPDLAQVNRLITATWIAGDKLYLLGTEEDAATLRQYL